MLNWYPPLLLQRVRVDRVSPDFLAIDVRAKRSLLNRNLNGTMFGGTIYAAADPVFPLMYWQALARRGLDLQTWLMATDTRFRRPAATDLLFAFRLQPDDLDQAQAELEDRGKAVRTHRLEALDREGEVCAELELVSYLRLLRRGDREVAGF
ncbi:MAG: PaaI family thioesterase [Planctomycetota bacterium]|jgi:acyl-coenzyme A thioesterase PaaI-like protein